jgi:hypothetical protein
LRCIFLKFRLSAIMFEKRKLAHLRAVDAAREGQQDMRRNTPGAVSVSVPVVSA